MRADATIKQEVRVFKASATFMMRRPKTILLRATCLIVLACGLAATSRAADLEPLRYVPAGKAGPVVDLGVGLWAWPLPMDYDHDGDLDLVVSCPDVPFKGTYLFENPGGSGPGASSRSSSLRDGWAPATRTSGRRTSTAAPIGRASAC